MIDYDNLLKELDFSKESFLDLCIMLGCDYNTNIPNIGPEKSISLLRKHKTIDNIDIDKSILNHIRVRELFSVPEKMDVYIPYCGIPDFENVEIFMNKNNIKYNSRLLLQNLGKSELFFFH